MCADPKLSQLDEDTATAYKAMLSQLSATGAGEVQQDQQGWRAWLQKVCPDQKDQGRGITVCLTNEYSTQLQMLKEGMQRAGGIEIGRASCRERV